MEYWRFPLTVGPQIYGATITWVLPSYSRSMNVGVGSTDGAGEAGGCCARAVAMVAASASGNVASDNSRFEKIMLWSGLPSGGILGENGPACLSEIRI